MPLLNAIGLYEILTNPKKGHEKAKIGVPYPSSTIRENSFHHPDSAMASTITVQNATYTLSVIGPLTTTFQPSTSCFRTLFQTSSNSIVLAPLALTGCYPSGFSAAFAISSATLAYYSPGVCPSGYYHATPVPDWLLRADETGVHCCPSYVSHPPVLGSY